ncbi:hypothetical protein PHET_00056, partial [Paragonimus heterotremus]
ERSLLGCQKQFVDECRSALKTVNYGRPNLKHCNCDGQSSRSIEDLSRCNLLRRNLISHPCMQDPPLLYRDIPKTDQTGANNADLYALLQPGLMDTVDLNSQPLIKNRVNDVQNVVDHSGIIVYLLIVIIRNVEYPIIVLAIKKLTVLQKQRCLDYQLTILDKECFDEYVTMNV